MDAGDAVRVLRRDRGDHARPIHPQRRKGLQVGLDAGAAAGVGAGDGDRDGGHRPRRSAAQNRRRRAVRARRFPDHGCIDSAEITATPSAPASITAAALLASMPAMPHTGKSVLARAQRRHDRAQAANTDRRIRIVLRGGRIDAADARIIDCLERRRIRQRHRLDRQPDDGRWPEQPPRVCGRHVVLPDMHAVGAGRERDIDAIVDHQRHAGAGEHRLNRPRLLDHAPRAPELVAQLDQRRAARHHQARQLG